MSAPALGFERDHRRSGRGFPERNDAWEKLELFRNSRLHCVGEDENAQVAKEETKKHRSQEGPTFEGNF